MSITPQAVKETAAAIEADFRAENPDTNTDTAKAHVRSVLGGSIAKITGDIERGDVAQCVHDAVRQYTNGETADPPVNDNANTSPLLDQAIKYSAVSQNVLATPKEITVREYFKLATTHQVGKKDELGIPLSVFRPRTADEIESKPGKHPNYAGPYRSQKTLVTCYGLSVDIDDKLQFADFMEKVKPSGYGFAAASTYSHGNPDKGCTDVTKQLWDRYRAVFVFDQPVHMADYGENAKAVAKLAISNFLDSIGITPYDKNATESLATNFYAPRTPETPFVEPLRHIENGKPVPFKDFMDSALEAVRKAKKKKTYRQTVEPGEQWPLPVRVGDKPVCLRPEEWCRATWNCFNIRDVLEHAQVEVTGEPTDEKTFYHCPHKQHSDSHPQVTFAYNPGKKADLDDEGWGLSCSGECAGAGCGDKLSQLQGLIDTGAVSLDMLADEQFYLPEGLEDLRDKYQFQPYIEELAKLLNKSSMSAYDKRKQELSDKLKVGKAALDKDAKKLQARWRDEARQADEEEASAETEEERTARVERERTKLLKSAGDLWASTNIPGVLADEFHKAGVVAEDVVLKALLLSSVARFFKKNIHVVVTGASASGKSYLTGEIIKTLPENAVIQTTSMSPKFIFYDEELWKHRIFYMQELSPLQNEDNDELTYIIRQVMSESRIDHRTIIDGKAEHLDVEGPITFWATTTADEWHAENDTRVIRIHTDETSGQTMAIAKMIGRKHGTDAPPEMSEKQLSRWHAFHKLIAIGPKKVVVPFADTVTDMLNPPLPVRIRRDAEKLFSLVEAHALTHQHNRELSAEGKAVATLDDYEAVRPIINRAIAESTGQRASDREILIVEHVLAAIDEQKEGIEHPGPDADTLEISTRTLSQQIGVEHSTVYRTLQAVLDAGYLVNVQTLPRHPYQLRKGKRDLVGTHDGTTVFPTVEQVRAEWKP